MCLVIPVACAQEAVATIQLPDSRTTQLTFTTIDVPGAGFTTVTGINSAGDIVGIYAPNSQGPYHGFLLRNGAFTYFDSPGAYSTFVGKINDAGVIVGNTRSLTGREVGFTYDGTTFTTIRAGKRPITVPIGVNNTGHIVGAPGPATPGPSSFAEATSACWRYQVSTSMLLAPG